MKTAIVILNWNGQELLKMFLPDVIKYSNHCAEVIVVDNGSTDGSVAYMKEFFSQIRLIVFSENLGFAGGYNCALKQVDAEYYVLLNTDVAVTSGWIEPVIEQMEIDRNIVACQPKIKSYAQKELFEHAGGAGGFIDRYGYPFCRGRMFNTLEKDTGQYNNTLEIFWATGACLFIRAEIFHQLNGFDEEFFAHMEEIDLCWRIQNFGYKIFCVPRSEVYHVGGGTLPKKNSHKTYLNFRNNLMMLHKNLPSATLLMIFILRLVLDGIAGIKFLFEGGFSDCLAVAKAHFYFYKNYRKRHTIRKQTQNNIKLYNSRNVYQHNVVIEYFIKRKKYFSQLNFKNN